MNNIFKSRKFRYGSIATAMTIVFIAVIVLINVIVSMLADRFSMQIDLTDNQLFEVSEETIDFLQDVEDDITIIITATEAEMTAGDVLLQHIDETIGQYALHGNNITVEHVDLMQNPDFARNYEESLSQGNVIVKSDKRYRVFGVYDLVNYTYDQYTYEPVIESSKVEQELTSAIMYVTDANPETVQVLTGRSEVQLDALGTLLESNGYSMTEVDIISDQLDPQASFAIIAAPRYDYTDAMIEKLDTWLDNDGQYGKTLLYVANTDQPELPILEAYLTEWGLEIGTGTIYETNDQNAYLYRNVALHQIVSELYTERLAVETNPILVAYSRPVNTLWEARGNRETEVLISTYDTATLRPSDAPDDWSVEDATETGSYASLVLSRKINTDASPYTQSNVIAVGSMYFFDETFFTMEGLNNADYLIAMFNEIAGREDSIVIAPKDLDSPVLALTDGQANVLGWLFAAIIPGVVIIFGVVVWLRRRNL